MLLLYWGTATKITAISLIHYLKITGNVIQDASHARMVRIRAAIVHQAKLLGLLATFASPLALTVTIAAKAHQVPPIVLSTKTPSPPFTLETRPSPLS
jgi:hypothetical protein